MNNTYKFGMARLINEIQGHLDNEMRALDDPETLRRIVQRVVARRVAQEVNHQLEQRL